MLYGASLIRVLFGLTNPFVLYQMTGLAATVASFFTARILLKSIGSSRYQITLGALLYAFAPFRLADLYGRSNLATHVAYVFIPLVWYSLIVIMRPRDSYPVKRIMQLGIWTALLALTNVPALFATGICIVIAGIVVRKELNARTITEILIGTVIGAGLCAYHFLSAISLERYAHLSNLNGGDPPFILLHLFERSSIPALYYIVMLYVAVAMIAVEYWRSRKSQDQLTSVERRAVHIGLAIVVLTIYLETPYVSLPAWRYIPILNFVQFGWRFYMHFVLFATVIVGIASSQNMRRAARNLLTVWMLGALIPVVLLVFSLHFFPHTSRPLEDPLEYRPIYSAPNDEFIKRLPGQNADFVAVIDEMTRIYAPHKSDLHAVAVLHDSEHITCTTSQPDFEAFDVRLLSPRQATFHRFFWPAWHVYVNSSELISRPDTIGRATATLPPGRYTLRWQLEKTPLELSGLWISGISWILVLLTLGTAFIHEHRNTAKTITPQ